MNQSNRQTDRQGGDRWEVMYYYIGLRTTPGLKRLQVPYLRTQHNLTTGHANLLLHPLPSGSCAAQVGEMTFCWRSDS